MKKSFEERISELRQELTAEIIRLIKSKGLESVSIPGDIDEKVNVIWTDSNGFTQDSEVLKVSVEGDGLCLEVQDNYHSSSVSLYSDEGIALRHVEWLEQIRVLLEYLLDS